jgi:hypothetical protein
MAGMQQDKTGAILGNVVLASENIENILRAVVAVAQSSSQPSSVKYRTHSCHFISLYVLLYRMLGISIANSFADLSAEHKSALLNTPGFIEAMQGLVNQESTCAAGAKQLLQKLGAFP